MQLTFRWKCIGALLILGVYCCSANTLASGSHASVQNRPTTRAPKDLDILVPLSKILDKFGKLQSLNVTLLIQTAVKLITECLPQSESGGFQLPLPFNLSHAVEMNKGVMRISETLHLKQEPLANYCNSTDFRTIHNFIWHEEDQLKDLLKFIHRFGLPTVYQLIGLLYYSQECPLELIADLPTGPDALIRNAYSQNGASYTNIREEIIRSNKAASSVTPFQAQCNLIEILTNLLQSGALELLQFIETLLEQFSTDASLHFLIGKIQEPVKGVSFRKFRELTEVRKLFYALNEALVNNELVSGLLDVVEQLLGLSLKDVNLVELIVSILEMLLWQNFDPVDPFP